MTVAKGGWSRRWACGLDSQYDNSSTNKGVNSSRYGPCLLFGQRVS